MSGGLLLIVLGGLAGGGFVVALLVTRGMIWLAPRVGLVDKPGHRKIHHVPKPLGGGAGIFAGVALPLLAGLAWVAAGSPGGGAVDVNLLDGLREQVPLALGVLLAGAAMFVLGLVDDRRALGPFSKLGVQLSVTAAFVLIFDVRLLTFLGVVPSVIVTVLWIAGVTNAFNFLDNMDGLSAGVAAVCSLVFLLTAVLAGQLFVPAALALFAGSLAGFLVWNFAPAKIFMGDAGSLFVGFMLGVLTVRTTYLPPGQTLAGGWYSVLVPVIVLALPLYDMAVVSLIRLARGRSPFVGDTNHISHRLVARGMTRRGAVLVLYFIAAATGIAAALLPMVQSTLAAGLILLQTLLVLGVVMLLERPPIRDPARRKAEDSQTSAAVDPS